MKMPRLLKRSEMKLAVTQTTFAVGQGQAKTPWAFKGLVEYRGSKSLKYRGSKSLNKLRGRKV